MGLFIIALILFAFAFGLVLGSLLKHSKECETEKDAEKEPVVGSDGVVILATKTKDPASSPIGDRAEITKDDQLLLS